MCVCVHVCVILTVYMWCVVVVHTARYLMYFIMQPLQSNFTLSLPTTCIASISCSTIMSPFIREASNSLLVHKAAVYGLLVYISSIKRCTNYMPLSFRSFMYKNSNNNLDSKWAMNLLLLSSAVFHLQVS